MRPNEAKGPTGPKKDGRAASPKLTAAQGRHKRTANVLPKYSRWGRKPQPIPHAVNTPDDLGRQALSRAGRCQTTVKAAQILGNLGAWQRRRPTLKHQGIYFTAHPRAQPEVNP